MKVRECLMPFGRFKGQAVRDLAADYLLWLASIEIRETWLRAAVDEEIERRRRDEAREEESRRDSFAARLNAPKPEVVVELVGLGLRAVARKYHPDVNGGAGSARMAEFNIAADWINNQASRALA